MKRRFISCMPPASAGIMLGALGAFPWLRLVLKPCGLHMFSPMLREPCSIRAAGAAFYPEPLLCK